MMERHQFAMMRLVVVAATAHALVWTAAPVGSLHCNGPAGGASGPVSASAAALAAADAMGNEPVNGVLTLVFTNDGRYVCTDPARRVRLDAVSNTLSAVVASVSRDVNYRVVSVSVPVQREVFVSHTRNGLSVALCRL